jgi:hypothetical protein
MVNIKNAPYETYVVCFFEDAKTKDLIYVFSEVAKLMRTDVNNLIYIFGGKNENEEFFDEEFESPLDLFPQCEQNGGIVKIPELGITNGVWDSQGIFFLKEEFEKSGFKWIHVVPWSG